MKRIVFFLPLCLVIVLLSSCGSIKNYAYLQNIDSVELSKTNFLYDARIMPKDILTINVSAVSQEAASPFNKNLSTNSGYYGGAGMGQSL